MIPVFGDFRSFCLKVVFSGSNVRFPSHLLLNVRDLGRLHPGPELGVGFYYWHL